MPSTSRPGSSRGRATPDSQIGPKLRANLNLLESSAASSATTVSSAAHSHNSHSHGLLNHLHHFLPRHATFHVCVQLHQIDSIPLTQGEFAVQWQIKHSTNSKHSSLNSSNASSKHSLLGFMGKGKERQITVEPEPMDEPNNQVTERLWKQAPAVPSVVISTDSHESHYPTPRRPSSTTASLSSASSSSSSSIATPQTHPPAKTLCSHPHAFSAPKGLTQFKPLKDHSVVWSQDIHTTVRMSIARPGSSSNTNAANSGKGANSESGALISSPMKLVVVQRIIPGDPGAPKNPRFGAVYLDLAEYAGVEGETTRKYLLRESKTNATLKLTISVVHVGGETNFIAPPLPKGEILKGVSGLLEEDVYKTRPKALDLYGPYHHYNQNRRELALAALNNLNASASAPKILSDSDEASDDGADDEDERFFDSGSRKGHSRSRSMDGHTPLRPAIHSSPSRSQCDLSKPESQTSIVPSRPQLRTLHKPTIMSRSSSVLSPIAASPVTPPNSAILSPGALPFDVTHLPYAYGPKTTENLIEAIFNPVPVMEKPGIIGSRTKIGKVPVEDNPFVYFIPKEEADGTDNDLTIGRTVSRALVKSDGDLLVEPSVMERMNSVTTVADTTDISSLYSTTPSSSASVSTSTSGNSLSASKSTGSCGDTRPSPKHSQSSPPPRSPKKVRWFWRNHTEIVAQSNPHSGTRPDLKNHVDSVVGIVH